LAAALTATKIAERRSFWRWSGIAFLVVMIDTGHFPDYFNEGCSIWVNNGISKFLR
jgi:hypothetical protein